MTEVLCHIAREGIILSIAEQRVGIIFWIGRWNELVEIPIGGKVVVADDIHVAVLPTNVSYDRVGSTQEVSVSVAKLFLIEVVLIIFSIDGGLRVGVALDDDLADVPQRQRIIQRMLILTSSSIS